MVCRLTVGKKAYAEVKQELTEVRDKADKLRDELQHLIEEDEAAFSAVMAAFKSPDRDTILEGATRHAAEVPLKVMKKALEGLELALVVARKGNVNSVSDAGVSGLMGQAAIEGAGYNVRINLGSLKDQDYIDNMNREVDEIRQKGEKLATEIRQTVESKL
jgi:formiminotetrahydrofolate cyclodeaminase